MKFTQYILTMQLYRVNLTIGNKMSWEIYTVHFDYATLPCKFDYREQNVMGHVRLVFWFFPPSEGKSVAKLAKSGQIWAHKSHFWISSQLSWAATFIFGFPPKMSWVRLPLKN